MRKLVVASIVLVVLAVLDQVPRLVAESKLAERAREAGPGAESADASITSWPFVGRLLALGEMSRVVVRVHGVNAGPLRLASVEVRATGVVLDRTALLSGDIRLEGIRRGTVTVELDAASLTRTLRVPVTIAGGELRVDVGGGAVATRVELGRNGSLVLRAGRLPALTLPIVRTALNPCSATRVAVERDRVLLTCELDELPAVLRR